MGMFVEAREPRIMERILIILDTKSKEKAKIQEHHFFEEFLRLSFVIYLPAWDLAESFTIRPLKLCNEIPEAVTTHVELKDCSACCSFVLANLEWPGLCQMSFVGI